MRAVVFHRHGGTDELGLVDDFPEPEIGPRDVLIRVHATSLNGFDPMILHGTTGLATPLPMVPSGDSAGEIVELGAKAAGGGFEVGDRVAPTAFVNGEGMTGETRLGCASEYVCFPIENMIAMPDGISYELAASLPIAYGAAFHMMRSRGAVQAGERVLILGATGGVGTCCVLLAKAAGAEVVATGSSGWKLDKLRELGADHVLDSSTGDWRQRVWDLYGRPTFRMSQGPLPGVDVVVNYVGGDTWVDALRCLRHGGRMLTCGATAGFDPPTDIRHIWSFERSIIGANGWSPEEQAELMAMVVSGELDPVIHAVRPLAETASSIQELIDREVFGKTIILPQA